MDSSMNGQIIPADITINEEIAQLAISSQFPLKITTIKLLGEGWDNCVYLVNTNTVFRFPRREISVPLIEREMRILPKLSKFVSLKIPEPIYLGKASREFPHPFYGHAMLSGTSGCKVTLSTKEYVEAAKKLGAFLSFLHGLDLKMLDLDTKDQDPELNRMEIEPLLRNLRERFEHIEGIYNLGKYQQKIQRICELAHKYRAKEGHYSFIHNDLYHRHLLFENNCLTGIIDWGDCGIGDQVADLGIVYQFFPKSVHAVFYESYGSVKSPAKDYAKFLGLYYAIAMLWFGHDRKDQDLIKTSLWTLAEI